MKLHRQYGFWYQHKAAQQTVQCAALIAPYVSLSIRWEGG